MKLYLRSIFKRAFLCGIILLPLLCQAQLKTPNKPPPKPVTKPATTQTPVAKKLFTDAGTVTDIDGNVYKTVKISNQIWMAENLKTSRYNDGSPIPFITDPTEWGNDAYCYMDNRPIFNSTYGKLYNWFAVNTGKLAPKGWHVPTDAEWTILSSYLGGEDVSGGAMKATTLWNNPNTGATNSSGFSGIPAGYRTPGGTYISMGEAVYFWSSTESKMDYAWARSLYYGRSSLDNSYDNGKANGYSVRCVKD